MKKVAIAVLLISFVLYGCSEEALPLVEETIVEANSSLTEEVNNEEVVEPVVMVEEVKVSTDEEYLQFVMDNLMMFSELMGEIGVQIEEMKNDLTVIDDEEWFKELENRYALVNDIYDEVKGTEYIPDAYQEFHKNVETALQLGSYSGGHILKGITERSDESLNDGYGLIKISSLHMRTANEILTNK